MGLCGSSQGTSSLTHTESWTSADSTTSDMSGEDDDNLDQIGTYTEFEQTNQFGMKCDPERVEVLLRNNSQVITRLTDARNPRGAGHVSCLNQCGPRATDEWVTTLAEALAGNTTLTELHFGSGHHLTEVGAQALAQIIEKSVSLQKLSLVYGTPGVGAGGTSKIAAALPMNNGLEILDLTSNAIGDNGAKALSSALGAVTQITESSAQSGNGESYVSAPGSANAEGTAEGDADSASSATGDGQKVNDGSEENVAAGEKPSDGELVANIAHSPESFRMNTTLRSLLLSGNGIGPVGAKSIATMVSEGAGAERPSTNFVFSVPLLTSDLFRSLLQNKTACFLLVHDN